MNLASFLPRHQDLEGASVTAVAGALLKVVLPKTRGGECSFSIHNEILAARGQAGRRGDELAALGAHQRARSLRVPVPRSGALATAAGQPNR